MTKHGEKRPLEVGKSGIIATWCSQKKSHKKGLSKLYKTMNVKTNYNGITVVAYQGDAATSSVVDFFGVGRLTINQYSVNRA